MATLGLEKNVVDGRVLDNTVARFKQGKVVLPQLSELADPTRIPKAIQEGLKGVDPDSAHPLNLFRVHWFNDESRKGRADVPGHLVLDESITGIPTRIVVALGDRFPMINAHKVLAAYGCLAPRLVTGQFDPTKHRAVWPSTGNYCRGGVAISKIMGCRGVAVLPEGMSAERFNWLDKWVADPKDVVKTFGSESNVKEIYDKCAELDRDPGNVIFNQFSEFGNHLVHWLCTGRALESIHEHMRRKEPNLRLAAFVSATGSAGTIAAGDHLKEKLGTRIVAVEAEECPTLLYNGFGAHNIQGIGDKHIPLIHNMMNTDFVVGVSDAASDSLFVLFNTEAGRNHLKQRRGVDPAVVDGLKHLGFSGIANVLAAIKTARYLKLGGNDVIATVATDSSAMYQTEVDKLIKERCGGKFDAISAAETNGRYLLGTATDHVLETTHVDRERIFNLGYFTWVEQQGISLKDFEARRHQSFWKGLRDLVPAWDALVVEMNRRIAA